MLTVDSGRYNRYRMRLWRSPSTPIYQQEDTLRVCPSISTAHIGYGENQMKKYLISYDLDKPGQDYTDLIAALRKAGAIKVLYSQWGLETTSTAVQIRDYLRKFIDGNDRLLVVELSGEIAWYNMIASDAFQRLIAA
jgi:hypothetical protein